MVTWSAPWLQRRCERVEPGGLALARAEGATAPRREQRLQIGLALSGAQQGMLITLDRIGLAICCFGVCVQGSGRAQRESTPERYQPGEEIRSRMV